MNLVADLHIHSHYSRATSHDLDLEHLHRVAQTKGITVVGTGDFTHPAWLAELKDKLVPAEPGLFRLRDDIARAASEDIPAACRADVRFLLSVEISSIYKRHGKTRKVHNLVYAPSLDVAERIGARLAGIGNITSDGRPILGLDSRDLLEIVLEASPDAYLVPAHIWTPWFSALGAQSGFDTMAECFADLSGHIFAAETGLSSDPAMNWRLSQLDRLALVSSSDAHSPDKLGREATLFDCELSYFALRDALRDRRDGLLGTVEFFPEEGKYHFDGHRKCGVVLTPLEAKELGRICPRCGKPLTAGVAGRVEDLADRPEGSRPRTARPFHSLVPLAEVLGELCGAGPTSARVRRYYDKLLRNVGPELTILRSAPPEELDRDGPPLLSEAIGRMRRGEVIAKPGYDGEYGVVRVFEDDERRRLLSQTSFAFAEGMEPALKEVLPAPGDAPEGLLAAEPPRAQAIAKASGERGEAAELTAEPASMPLRPPTSQQRLAVEHENGPLLLVAGPGTGKTRTIVERIAWLIQRRGVSPRSITAITFTRKAAGELRDRLSALAGEDGARVEAMTFHSLGQRLLSAFGAEIGAPVPFTVADEGVSLGCAERALAKAPAELSVKALRERISWAKAHLVEPSAADEDILGPYTAYEEQLRAAALLDFDDLVRLSVRLLAESPAARAYIEERARYLFIDEYQDVQLAQYQLVRAMASAAGAEGLCAVGDPDQAIYGFRGSTPAYFARFQEDFPAATAIALADNYRSSGAIVRAATLVIEQSPGRPRRPLAAHAAGPSVLRIQAATCLEEADRVAAEIARALGGTSLLTSGGAEPPLALHEIAVLFRTSAQAITLGRALEREGIPYFVRGEEAMEERFEPQKVALLTLHASKGLEFPLVFVTGCEDGLLPLRLPGLRPGDIEEERRLLYVGMTRAKQRLVVTSAERRTLFGRTMENAACPYLTGLPKDTFTEAGARPKKKGSGQLPLF